jgi:hypothetical protein
VGAPAQEELKVFIGEKQLNLRDEDSSEVLSGPHSRSLLDFMFPQAGLLQGYTSKEEMQ